MLKKPVFPEFKKLEISDRDLINDFTKDFESYSDFNFVSMYTWDIEDKMEFSFLNQNLVVKFKDYTSDNYFYSFLGTNKVFETINTLLQYSEEQGLKRELKLVPEVVVKRLNDIDDFKFNIFQDRNSWDYIYDIKKTAELKGKEYFNKRKNLNKFRRKYPEFYLSKINNCEINLVEDLLDKWVRNKSENPETLEESKAIKKLLKNTMELDVTIYQLGNKDMTVAFFVLESLNNSNYMGHYAKYDILYPSSLCFIEYLIVEDLNKLNGIYINFEQDLGDFGIRKSKELWHPIKFLKKYTIDENR